MALSTLFAPTSRSSLSLYLALRLFQVGSCSIAGFIFCYLIWQHNNHYCAHDWTYTVTAFNCTPWQRQEAIVPNVYIWLVTAIVAAIISAFVLSYRQLSFFAGRLINEDSQTGFPTQPIRLSTEEPDAPLTNEDGEKPMPITMWLKGLPHSVPQMALVIDVLILVVFFCSWQEYSQHMILGPVIPYCYLWGPTGRINDEYWKNLKVVDKECILSQCSWVTCMFAMGFMIMIVALEAYYVHEERKEKRMMEGPDECSEAVVGQDEKGRS